MAQAAGLAAGVGHSEPLGHGRHSIMPRALYVPEGQSATPLPVGEGHVLPAGHAVQLSWLPALKLPVAHGTGCGTAARVSTLLYNAPRERGTNLSRLVHAGVCGWTGQARGEAA